MSQDGPARSTSDRTAGQAIVLNGARYILEHEIGNKSLADHRVELKKG